MNDRSFIQELPDGKHAIAIRAQVDADPALIAEALELPAPSPVLLVIGGASLMSQEQIDRLSHLFTVIAETMAQEQITVIDGGTQAGVMAMMGEALAKTNRTAPYIGVLPAYAEVEPGGPRGEEVLESNHSHFVLIESDEWGRESEFMSNLATHLSDQASSLVLLVNGGQIALQDVEWSIQQGREIIVIAGSGRLADEIAQAVRHPEHKVRDRVATITQKGHITLFDLSSPPDELTKLLEHRLKKV